MSHESGTTLVQWIDSDDYGYTYGIERDLAAALALPPPTGRAPLSGGR